MQQAEAGQLTFRPRSAMLFFAIFLLVQVGLPLRQLFLPYPARFGWQMFARARIFPNYWTVTRDGVTAPVDVSIHFYTLRPEIELGSEFPDHLCRTLTDVAMVRSALPDGTKTEVYRCP